MLPNDNDNDNIDYNMVLAILIQHSCRGLQVSGPKVSKISPPEICAGQN